MSTPRTDAVAANDSGDSGYIANLIKHGIQLETELQAATRERDEARNDAQANYNASSRLRAQRNELRDKLDAVTRERDDARGFLADEKQRHFKNVETERELKSKLRAENEALRAELAKSQAENADLKTTAQTLAKLNNSLRQMAHSHAINFREANVKLANLKAHADAMADASLENAPFNLIRARNAYRKDYPKP